MVVIACNLLHFNYWSSPDYWFGQSCRSLYLYLVLIMSKSRATETILTISIGFLVLFLLKSQEHIWMLYTALTIGVLGLFWKWFRIQIHLFWFWLADKLGFVMSRLILSILFVLILIPFALLAGLFRKDSMFMKGGQQSYFKSRSHLYSSEDLENPW